MPTANQTELEEWIRRQIWPSLEAITLKCPRPHAGSGGYHWWYNDTDDDMDPDDMEPPEDVGYIHIVCKTCGLRLKLDSNAPEYPAI